MNFGIEAGKPLADECIARGMPPLFQNNVIYVVLLWGGLTTNAVYCLVLNVLNGSYTDYYTRTHATAATTAATAAAIPTLRARKQGDGGGNRSNRVPLGMNYAWCGLAGSTWFMQFFFYGMGESKLGNGASSWILHMTFIILTANAWGFYLGEWDAATVSTVPRQTIIRGVVTLLASVLTVGVGNSLTI